jgi:prepilin-type N-terminal cleavage/methylation domain-containing protein
MYTTQRIQKKRKQRIASAKNSAGFTLIELMVAMSIFSVVMVMSMTSVFTIISVNRKAQSLSSVIDNLNFAVESMTRTIKTNTEYTIGTDAVTVENDDGQTLRYSRVVDAEGKGRIMLQRGSATAIPITASEVDVDTFRTIRLYDVDGCEQPMLAIVIRGTATVGEEETEFSLQTVISQRDLLIKTSCLI